MADRQRHINVAAFADRFAVVQCLHHGQQTAVFLQKAGDCIKDTRTFMARLGPCRLRLAGGFDGGLDLGCGAFGYACQLFACGWVVRWEIIAQCAPFAVDVMARNAATIGDPLQCLFATFRGRAVFHGVEDFFDGHDLCSHINRVARKSGL